MFLERKSRPAPPQTLADCGRLNTELLRLQDPLFTLAWLLVGSEAVAEKAVDLACQEACAHASAAGSQAFCEQLYICLVRACRGGLGFASPPSGKASRAVKSADPAVCFASLPFDTRAALALVDRERFSYAQAARILGCSEQQVLTRLAAGRRAFAGLLEEKPS